MMKSNLADASQPFLANLDANARHLTRRVIISQHWVQTYDRSIAIDESQAGLEHDGDLFHSMFLYNMALNGNEEVQALE